MRTFVSVAITAIIIAVADWQQLSICSGLVLSTRGADSGPGWYSEQLFALARFFFFLFFFFSFG